jgi:shikimate dehydrogenase
MQDAAPHARVTWVSATTRLADLPLADYDLLVNTTSVGMWPQTDLSPWPETLPMPGHWTVYDLVYNPAETRLMAQAAAAGATTIGGLGMLVHQGALAFEMWTGQAAPTDVMHVAAERALGQASPEGAGTEN